MLLIREELGDGPPLMRDASVPTMSPLGFLVNSGDTLVLFEEEVFIHARESPREKEKSRSIPQEIMRE